MACRIVERPNRFKVQNLVEGIVILPADHHVAIGGDADGHALAAGIVECRVHVKARRPRSQAIGLRSANARSEQPPGCHLREGVRTIEALPNDGYGVSSPGDARLAGFSSAASCGGRMVPFAHPKDTTDRV